MASGSADDLYEDVSGLSRKEMLDSIRTCLKVLGGNKLQTFMNELDDDDEIDDVSMTVFVKTKTGHKTCALNGLKPTDTAAMVKAMLFDKDDRRLIYSGKTLENRDTLKQCNIQKESVIDEVGRLSAGAKVKLDKKMLKASLTENQKVLNLVARFKKAHEGAFNQEHVEGAIDALFAGKAALKRLKDEGLKVAIGRMTPANLLALSNLSDDICSIGGVSNTERRLACLLQHITPEITSLSKHSDIMNELSQELLTISTECFAKTWFKPRGDDEALK
jgi:hypothetical protein